MYVLYIIYAQKVTRNYRSEFTRAFGNRSVYHEKRTETILMRDAPHGYPLLLRHRLRPEARLSYHAFGPSGIIKREVQPQHLSHLLTTRSQHTYLHPTIKGVRTMDNLLLNARILRQQATGVQIKNLVSILLTICSLLASLLRYP